MSEHEEKENLNEKAPPQTPEPEEQQQPEPAVKSRAAEVQATVDRNLAEHAARQKLTDEVIAKRKQIAALEAAEQTEEQIQAAESCTGVNEDAEEKEGIAAESTAEIVNHVIAMSNTRELREIEMHNSMMDALKEVTGNIGDTVELLKAISVNLSDIAQTMKSKE